MVHQSISQRTRSSKWRYLAFLVVLGVVFVSQTRVLANTKGDYIIEEAQSYVGICEEGGNNQGYEVTAFLGAVGLGSGYAWCSAFVAYILDRCETPHKINAWAPSAVANSVVWKRGDETVPPILPGDVFGIHYAKLKRIGHVGFVEDWNEDSAFANTVEGNTNSAGARDSETGDCVMRKKRSKNTITRISRPWR